jgi:hypothetical protein
MKEVAARETLSASSVSTTVLLPQKQLCIFTVHNIVVSHRESKPNEIVTLFERQRTTAVRSGRSCLCMLAVAIRYCKEWYRKEGFKGQIFPTACLKMIGTSPQTGAFWRRNAARHSNF